MFKYKNDPVYSKLSKEHLFSKIRTKLKAHAQKHKVQNIDIGKCLENLSSFIAKNKIIGKNLWGYGIFRISNGVETYHINSNPKEGMYLSLFKLERKQLVFRNLFLKYSGEIESPISNFKLEIKHISGFNHAVGGPNRTYMGIQSKEIDGSFLIDTDSKANAEYYERAITEIRDIELEGAKPIIKILKELNAPELSKLVTDEKENIFLQEAINCFSVKAYRASIIMTWNLTLDHLYNYILKHKKIDFDSMLALNKSIKINAITKIEEFSEFKESQFLLICRQAKILSKNQYQILEIKLKIRNTCAHPSSGIIVKRHKAIEFIEELVHNVISKFKI